MTKPEVIKRLAIKAVLDAIPSSKRQQVAALFHTSLRVVTDAARHTTAQLTTMLAMAPAQRPHVHVIISLPPVKAPTDQQQRPGSRARALLDEPEETIDIPEDATVEASEPLIDDEALERAASEADDALDRALRGQPTRPDPCED